MAHILIIEDNKSSADSLARITQEMGHSVDVSASAEAGLQKLHANGPDLVLTDLRLPGADGIDVLKEVKKISSAIEVVVMTAYGQIDDAVQAIRLGAFDFLTKPLTLETVEIAVNNALSRRELNMQVDQLQRENIALKQREKERRLAERIIGKSPAMKQVLNRLNQVAPTNASVLIRGESGTGKELIARALHDSSDRHHKPFSVVNCSIIDQQALETELFGVEKDENGRKRMGRLESANKGTLFLDEVGDLPPETQGRLVRLMQERKCETADGGRRFNIDVRIIASTKRNLETAVEENEFREDLYYKLNVVPIYLPPLRERKEDLPLLLADSLKKFKTSRGEQVTEVVPEVMEAFLRFSWPGNVRQLENVVERMVVLSSGTALQPEVLPDEIRDAPQPTTIPLPEGDIHLSDFLDDIERRLIMRAMERSQGVKAHAASSLGLERNAFRYKLKKYGLD